MCFEVTVLIQAVQDVKNSFKETLLRYVTISLSSETQVCQLDMFSRL